MQELERHERDPGLRRSDIEDAADVAPLIQAGAFASRMKRPTTFGFEAYCA